MFERLKQIFAKDNDRRKSLKVQHARAAFSPPRDSRRHGFTMGGTRNGMCRKHNGDDSGNQAHTLLHVGSCKSSSYGD